tara:strand:- start:379 stop:612 length:234 start_codon:yes stop_codon:yes gene_type:complete
MAKEYNTTATHTKGARVVSDYGNDMIFEQPRKGLVQQEFVSYESVEAGMKRSVTTRRYTINGGYDDTQTITILPRNI